MYIIPLEGDGTIENPFRPAFLEEAPPGLHYDLLNNVAIFDEERALKSIEIVKDEKSYTVLREKIEKAVEKLRKLAEEEKVRVVE